MGRRIRPQSAAKGGHQRLNLRALARVQRLGLAYGVFDPGDIFGRRYQAQSAQCCIQITQRGLNRRAMTFCNGNRHLGSNPAFAFSSACSANQKPGPLQGRKKCGIAVYRRALRRFNPGDKGGVRRAKKRGFGRGL